MTIQGIARKLMRQNKGRYLLFGASVSFAIAMIGAYGVLLFSPTIRGALMTDGSTYMISLAMYVISIVGIALFLLYANEIFQQSVQKEAGIFLSLGLRPKEVSKMEGRQYHICFFAGGALGLILCVPLSLGAWRLLTLFITYTDKTYQIGMTGLFAAIGVWIAAWAILHFKNSVALRRLDVVSALKSDSKSEDSKAASPALGLAGLVMIPLGIILFNVTAVNADLKSYSSLFLGISLVGVYLMTAQITGIGAIVKRVCPSNYRKNLLFYNLVRQKGKQYTLAMFVSSVLIALTVFSVCFNGSGFLESYYRVKEDPYDFALLADEEQTDLRETEIRALAEQNGVGVTDFLTLHLLAVGREHQYQDAEANEWSTDYAVSVSEFRQLSGMALDLAEDGYAYFQDSDDSMFQTCQADWGNFYDPTAKAEFLLRKEQLLSEQDILNNSAQLDSLLILSDATWQGLSSTMDDAYKLNYYLFNGIGLENSRAFQNALLDKIVTSHHGEMLMNPDQQAVRDKLTDYKDEIIPYAGNELEAARSWLFYPYARETQIDLQIETGAVYLLLVFFIALISFVSATMIIALKAAGTIQQDTGNYRKAVYLGLKRSDLRRLIVKQMGLVFFFPSICGCLTALLMINRFLSASTITHYRQVTWVAAGLSFAVFLLQILIFCIFRKKLVADAIHASEV